MNKFTYSLCSSGRWGGSAKPNLERDALVRIQLGSLFYINTIMHKIRNTKHLEVLKSLLGTTPHGCSGPLSKKSLWKLCIIKKWDKKKVLESIENDTWWTYFCDD